MKKIYLLAIAIATVFTGCSKDEEQPSQEGMFTVQNRFIDENGVETKAPAGVSSSGTGQYSIGTSVTYSCWASSSATGIYNIDVNSTQKNQITNTTETAFYTTDTSPYISQNFRITNDAIITISTRKAIRITANFNPGQAPTVTASAAVTSAVTVVVRFSVVDQVYPSFTDDLSYTVTIPSGATSATAVNVLGNNTSGVGIIPTINADTAQPWRLKTGTRTIEFQGKSTPFSDGTSIYTSTRGAV